MKGKKSFRSVAVTIDDFLYVQENLNWRPNNAVPTAVAMVRERWLVQGFQDGSIRITSLDDFSSQTKNTRTFVGHADRVTCLMAPEISKQYLLSGSADFTVKVWNMELVLSSHALVLFSASTDPLAPKQHWRALVHVFKSYRRDYFFREPST